MNTPPGDDRDALEQLLRDERTLRAQAERRAAESIEKATLWRKRAEDRAARIERLVEERATPSRLPRFFRRARPAAPSAKSAGKPIADTPGDREPPPHRPAFPSIQVAAAVADPSLHLVVREMRCIDLIRGDRVDDATFAPVDLVVVDGGGLAGLPDGARRAFESWKNLAGRAPLVCIGTPTISGQSTSIAVDGYPQVFDVNRDRPSRTIAQPTGDRETRDGTTVHLGGGEVAGVSRAAGVLADPPAWLVAAGARGVPIYAEAWDADETAIRKAGVRARRWAHRHHHPAIAAARLLADAAISVPDHRPTVAAILVSNRLADLPGAIDRIARQTWGRAELVVGLHGVAIEPPVREALDRAATRMPVGVIERPAEMSLGAVLNDAIEASYAPLVAKIDDDDFYGPAYLEDAVQAFAYTDAAMVGKGAQFAYIAEEDRTVLRRPDEEETFMGGIPTGASTVMRRAVWDAVKFPHRPRFVDSIFFSAARELGFVPYANTRWEFCVMRRPSGHTYDASATTLTAGAAEVFAGYHPDRLSVADFDAGT